MERITRRLSFPKTRNVEDSTACKCKIHAVANISAFRESSPIDDFLLIERDCPNGSCKSVKFVDDVYMLFNQKRLDKLTLQNFINHLDSQPQSNDSLSYLRKNVSDDDLFKFVKDRQLQTLSELTAWSSYLTSEAENVVQDARAHIAEQQAQVEAQTQTGNSTQSSE